MQGLRTLANTRILDQDGKPFKEDKVANAMRAMLSNAVPIKISPDYPARNAEYEATARVNALRAACGAPPRNTTIKFRRHSPLAG